MKRKWVSNQRCRLCLSSQRTLHYLENLRGPYQLITGSILSSKQACERRVCWECRAILHRLLCFRRQARHAESVLDSASNNTHQFQHITSLSSLSTTKPHGYCVSVGLDKDKPRAKCQPKLIISPVVTHEFRDGILYDFRPLSPVFPTKQDLCVGNSDPEFCDDESDDGDHDADHETRDDDSTEETSQLRVVEFAGTDEDVTRERAHAESGADYRNATFKCMSCLIGLPSLALFKQHVSKYHTKSVGAMMCNICQCRFSQQRELDVHVEQHRRLYRCYLGDYIGRTQESVSAHIKSEHTSDKVPRIKKEKAVVLQKIDPLALSTEPTAPPITDLFTKQKVTQEQIRTILGEKRNDANYVTAEYKCDSCFLGFRDEKSFKRHNRCFKHYKMPKDFFKCEVCANSFAHLDSLREHAKTHDTLYTCCLDEYSSLCLQNILSHMSVSHKYTRGKTRKKRVSGMTLAQLKSKIAKVKAKLTEGKPKDEEGAPETKVKKEMKDKVKKETKDKVKKESKDKVKKEAKNKMKELKVNEENKPGEKREKQVLLRKMLRDDKCETFKPSDEEVRNMKDLFRFKSSRKSCDDCCIYFGTDERIFEHRKLHAEAAGSYMCDICKLRFTTEQLLTEHREGHYVWFRCRMDLGCRYFTHTKKRMALHIYKMHKPPKETSETSAKRYECDVCQKVFTTSRGILNHTRRHDKQHMCDYCGLRHSGYSELVHHIKQRHTKARDKKRNYPEGVQRPKKLGDNTERQRNYTGEDCGKQFVCEFCPKRFKNMSLLKYHRNQHYNHKPYACKLCDVKFCDPNRRSLHMSNVHLGKRSETFRCSICRQEFPSKFKYNRHLLTHEEQRHYKCEQCPKAFFTYNTLVNHQVVHTQEQKYECEVCFKKFTFLAHLNVHINRSHRARECDSCGKQFGSVKSWKEHLKTHRMQSEESSVVSIHN